MNTNEIIAQIVASALAAQQAVPAPANNAVQIVTLILAGIAPVLSALAIYLMRLATANIAESKKELIELKENVDGKMSQLLTVTAKAAYANGSAEQRATAAMVQAAHSAGVIEQLKVSAPPTDITAEVKKQVAQEINKLP